MSDRLTILDQHTRTRQVFDPTNKDHLSELKFFMTNSKWRVGCPFYLRNPFVEIPAMCFQQFAEHSIK